jgi:hypothetical protein
MKRFGYFFCLKSTVDTIVATFMQVYIAAGYVQRGALAWATGTLAGTYDIQYRVVLNVAGPCRSDIVLCTIYIRMILAIL